eukprot:TRINITY_DN20038_c0_g1_i2.p1 TRINITY_DN20038_c0_g1~~TRINITY_DN20038_c0_g1_i2.p1  ORF type:complete len:306 (-),score=77.90 TRINITY_DN20038_c0_g1_i2:395-1312(-)
MHDMTVTILSLPMVYGIMSYKSVFRCWQIMTNNVGSVEEHYYSSFDERKAFLEEMYESNFVVGDIYEAFSLLVFGKLTIMVVKRSLKVTLADRVKGTTKEGSWTATSNLQDLKGSGDEVLEWTVNLVNTLAEVTTDGIKLFVLACTLNAMYLLTVSTCAYMRWFPEYFGKDGSFQTDAVKMQSTKFFSGAGFIASFAAIGNIMRIEEDFEEALEEFKPFWKFWGTKILVSLAFLQSILFKALPPFSSLSTERSNMLFAILLCYECFFVALLQLKAWHYSESWFHDIYEDASPLTKKLLGDDSWRA